MTRKQLTLLIVLAAICAYVNRGLFLSGPDNDVQQQGFYQGPENKDVSAGPGELPDREPKTSEAAKPRPLERTSLNEQSPDSSAVVLAHLSQRIAERERYDRLITNRDPFLKAPKIEATPEVQKPTEQDIAELKRKQAAEEKARQEQIAKALEEQKKREQHKAALKALSEISLHAIIKSKKSAVARMEGRNLRLGDRVPGTEAIIESIEKRRVIVRLGQDKVAIPLTHGKRVRRKHKVEPEGRVKEAHASPPPALLRPDPRSAPIGGTRK